MSSKRTAENPEFGAESAEVSVSGLNALGHAIIGAAIRAHAALGPAYPRLGGYRLGYLLNFTVIPMKDGTRRPVNGL